MPKQRLVDFRGGIGEKISPHMIGETQGQSAQDVDLSSVRLQGRKKLDTSTVAGGSYYYETGLLAGGRFVSIHPADHDSANPSDSPYIEYASDFVTWNLDLYVATGNPGSDGTTYGDGKLLVYRDGGTDAVIVDFQPPATATATLAYQANTELIAEVGEITYDNTSTKLTATNATIPQWGTNDESYTRADAADHSGYSTWTRPGLSVTYYTQGSSGDLKRRTGGSAGETYDPVNITVNNAGSYGYSKDGSLITISSIQYDGWAKGSTKLYSPNNTPNAGLYNVSGGPTQQGPNSSYKWEETSTDSTTPIDLQPNVDTNNYWKETIEDSSNTVIGDTDYSSRYKGEFGFDQTWTTAEGLTAQRGTYVSETVNDNHQVYSDGGSRYTEPAHRFYVVGPGNGAQGPLTYAIYQVWVHGTYMGQYEQSEGHVNLNSVYINGVIYRRGNLIEQTTSTSGYPVYMYALRTRLTEKTYKIRVTGSETTTTDHLKVVWAGSTKYNSNISAATSSVTGNDGKTYRKTGSANSSNQWKVQQDGAYVRGSQATYTQPATAPSFTYAGPVYDNVIREASAGTLAFTYDEARLYKYNIITNAALGWTEDPAKNASPGWLLNDRTFNLDTHGYYLSTVRNANGVPAISQKATKVTLTGNPAFETGLKRTPHRLDFTVTAPSDNASNTSQPLVCYQLVRYDSLTTSNNPVSLCYVLPGASESFSRSGNTITISNLTASTKYKLYWTAYSGTTIKAGTDATAKSNPAGGYSFTTGASQTTLELTATKGDYLAADFWLDREVMDDLYARVQCFELFIQGSKLSLAESCDYLDLYSISLGCNGLTGANRDGVPSYLKFLTESNNFFFAVGTARTEIERYGEDSTDRENRAGAFLFISEYNNPREWPTTGYVEFEDEITGIASYPGELLVWTRHGTYRVYGSRPDMMRKIKLATTEGMPVGNHGTAVLVGRYLAWASQTGICIYDGASVANLSRPRLTSFPTSISNGAASQFEGKYYLIKNDETGWMVDFNLEGFPIVEVDLTEGDTSTVAHPALIYRPQTNTLYSRRGLVEGASTNRNAWSYRTRGFDGGNFGSMKLVKTVTLNGIGSGYVQVNLDGRPVFAENSGKGKKVSIAYEVSGATRMTQPVRVYLPAANNDSPFGISAADVWDVQITDWQGDIDWIDTEYEVLSGA